MAFNLFSKKQETIIPAAKKTTVRPAASKASPEAPASAPMPAAATPDDDDLSLDFTSPHALDELPHIDFEEGAACTHCVIEEAAMLFANGQIDATCKTLKAAIAADDLGADAERGWRMLLDIYQIQGEREAFETAALSYAARFEKSPPAWVPAVPEAVDPTLATGGRAFVSLSGALNAQAGESLKQLVKIAQSNPVVRLELSKLQDADNGGCNLLLQTLAELKRAKKEVVFGGAEKLIALLAPKIQPGTRENEAAWLMLLDLYQRQMMQDAFEDLAVNYAITFEVSPPSWEMPAKRPATASAKAASPAETKSEAKAGCALSGEILSAGMDEFSRISAAAEGCEDVTVDLSRLNRIDFVSTGQFLNVLTTLQKAGKRIHLVGVNQLLAALFDVMGVSKVADVTLRKI
ncbi:MAG: STAS domain-containing protein [Rhodocyclaceae bacterium]|nr:STAS domain-containing protein [Rhodocyclaceae bacterium]